MANDDRRRAAYPPLVLVTLSDEQIDVAKVINGPRTRPTHALTCGPYGQVVGTYVQCRKYYEAWKQMYVGTLFVSAFESDTFPVADLKWTPSLANALIDAYEGTEGTLDAIPQAPPHPKGRRWRWPKRDVPTGGSLPTLVAAKPVPSKPTRVKRGRATWVPSGGSFVVGGRPIRGGMVYVGSDTRSAAGDGGEPCLIDPRLRVKWRRPDWGGESMGYWPSYDGIQPSARAAYLSWLAGGRRDEAAYIGYVFLFFYGLERRLFVDLGSDCHHAETDTIVAEVEQLLDIYGGNSSFSGYASALLDFVGGLRAADTETEVVSWDPAYRRREVPAAVRVGIGRYVGRGLRIPPEWALSYLRYHPDVRRLRMPARRCPSEFDELFKVRYRDRFGNGVKVRRPARKLELSYRPASGGFGSEVSVTIDSIPDVTSVIGPINKLKDLAMKCTDELDAYSRFVGRHPDKAGTAEATGLLPDVLLASRGGPVVADLRGWASERLAGRSRAVVSVDDLVGRWSPERTTKLTKRETVSLAALLGKLGVGVEPDVRFGAPTPKPGSKAVLFRLPEGSSTAPSATYTAAMALVHLTALVAAADGTITAEEQQHLSEHVERTMTLDPTERVRLESHLAYLGSGKLGMAGVKRKVEALPLQERTAVGGFLVGVAAADGVISPEEIITLTKVFGYLGLDEAHVYRQVHAVGTGDAGPVTVREAKPDARWSIPAPTMDPQQPPARVELDPAKVEARLAETAHVTALLTEIFAEDESPAGTDEAQIWGHGEPEVTAAESGVPAATGVTIGDLDVPHSAFVLALTERQEWVRSDLEDLAEALGLPFLDGVLDAINEAALDACGEPLVEGDDPLELNTYAIEELS